MKRREFLKLGGAASLSVLAGAGVPHASANSSETFYVSTEGNDDEPGTLEQPFASLSRAQLAVRKFRTGNPDIPVTVLVRRGTYYFGNTLVFTPEDSGTAEAPIVFAAFPEERVTLSGGRRLQCRWQTRKSKSICDLAEGNTGPFAFSELFVNGKRQVRARYPDCDASAPAASYLTAVRALPAGTSSPEPMTDEAAPTQNGVIGIEFDPETFSQRRWGKPEEAVIHMFQQNGLGTLAWQIRSIDYDRNRIWFAEGGDQLGNRWRASFEAVGKGSRFFVDNLLEEMSTAGEWYLSRQSETLYYRSEQGTNLENALIEIPVLDQIIRLQGADSQPVEFLTFAGFRFAHTETTYMRPHETSPLGNWAVFRGGAVVLEGTRNCTVRDCWFDALGGNAVFMSKSNHSGNVSRCVITECGGTAICFAGAADRVQAGRRDSPSECVASDNIIRSCGVFSKQSAGIYISSAYRITATHNEIRNMPCSAIFIADSASSGHMIEHNDLLDTVEETLHYGPIHANGDTSEMADIDASQSSSLPNTDETTVIRENLIRGRSDCAIRLDHGAMHCDVYNNIAIGSAIRILSGAHRNIYNNIWYDSSEPVGFLTGDSGKNDRYHHNVAIINRDRVYDLVSSNQQGERVAEIDYNCIFQPKRSLSTPIASFRSRERFNATTQCALADWQKLGYDQHSAFADPLIANPTGLEFRLLEHSPALKLGFVNFPSHQWGPSKTFTSIWKDAQALAKDAEKD